MKKIMASMLVMMSMLGAMTPAALAGEGCGCKPCKCVDCQCGK